MSTRTTSTTWFLQVNSQVCGPLPFTELRDLFRSKVATSDSLVSRDGKTWHRIAETPEFDGQAAPGHRNSGEPAPAAQSPASHVSTLIWVVAGVLGGAALLTGTFAALAVLTNSGATSSETAAATSQSIIGTSDPVAEASLQYWLRLKQVVSAPLQPGPNAIAQLTGVVAQIEAIPVVNVDSDLVGFAYDTCALLRAGIQNNQRQGEVGYFVECFLRGFSGDFLGPLNDQIQTSNAMQSRFQALSQQAKRLRAVLSQRYGFEFPPL